MNSLKNPLIKGTVILTLTGFLTRIIGFFYRIFISHTFGEEGMGLFQLITPVMAFAFSLCCAGIQTAVSKFVAGESTHHNYRSSFRLLLSALTLTLSLSVLTAFTVYIFADTIACKLLLEQRTAPLLRLLALSFPLSAIHCCANGYFYGIKNAKIPALLQLTEQIFRVGSVLLLYQLMLTTNHPPHITLALIGVFIGECSSMLLSLTFLFGRFHKLLFLNQPIFSQSIAPSGEDLIRIILFAAPLTLNRIIINFLQSIEAVFIPEKLRQYGFSSGAALSSYGVLTGMALSLILFPCAITNSISVLLLPIVSEAEENGKKHTIAAAIKKSVTYCMLLGLLCTIGFFLFGSQAGVLLFNSQEAGCYIKTLSFICPFLYITATLGSILHGLGKTFLTFLINIGALSIRILSIFLLVPRIGLTGYLIGLLCSQCFSALLCIFFLREYRMY